MKPLLILVALLLGASVGRPAFVVVPNDLAHVEGNSSALAPFTAPRVGGTNPPSVLQYYSMRYQQVYEASQFAAVAPEGELLEEIGIRIKTDFRSGYTAVLRDVQVNLSTTQKAPDGLSTNFQENVGPDDTVVFPRAQLDFAWFYSPFERPQGFGGFIPNFWFFYRPSAGNLLLDIRVFTYSNSLPAAPFDASDVPGDSVSIVSSTNVSSPVGTPSTIGLVTWFHTFPTAKLSVTWTNADLMFTWLDYPRGYVLQTRDCLDCPLAWQRVAEPGMTNEYDRVVILPLEADIPTRLYRLSWTPPPQAMVAAKDAAAEGFTPPHNR